MEFSILLSGVIVKFGVLGLARFVVLPGSQLMGLVLAAISLVAMVEALLKLPAQRDLKRIVALTTVVEMNWLTLCLALGGLFEDLARLLLVVHSFATALEFYLVECISRRFGSRDIAKLAGLSSTLPLL